MYDVHIQASKSPTKHVQLTIHGQNAAKVARMLGTRAPRLSTKKSLSLDHPPRELDVQAQVAAWLLAEGSNGIRLKELRVALQLHAKAMTHFRRDWVC